MGSSSPKVKTIVKIPRCKENSRYKKDHGFKCPEGNNILSIEAKHIKHTRTIKRSSPNKLPKPASIKLQPVANTNIR